MGGEGGTKTRFLCFGFGFVFGLVWLEGSGVDEARLECFSSFRRDGMG